MDSDELALDALALSPCSRYFWRSQPLNKRSGSDIFLALFQSQTKQQGVSGIATLLESPSGERLDRPHLETIPETVSETVSETILEPNKTETTKLARYSICAGAPRFANNRHQLWTPEVGSILPFLQRLSEVPPPLADCDDETLSVPSSLPFLGGWLGWLGYDLAWEIERLPWLKDDSLPFPTAFWYEPAEFALLDHQSQRLWLAADTCQAVEALSLKVSVAPKRINQKAITHPAITQKGLTQKGLTSAQLHKPHQLQKKQTTARLKFESSQAEFQQAVRQAKAHIQAGDVFQVNHSLRFQAKTTLSGWAVYQALHQINPSPFASYWHTPWGSVVSCSPERLVQMANGIAQSRPIAGTRPRGATPDMDALNAKELLGDSKERAEHIMLVDLERNDLGRVCEWGSVRVDELMTIERYSHVMHLVSNVVGRLNSEAGAAQLIAALFPGGTITGCPKVRCMEIIEALEPVRRSLFYGSCGYLDRRGRLDLNILIRTLMMSADDEASDDTSVVWGQVGAGIVADSDPEREWKESLQKAKAQLLALGLSEDLIFSQ